MKHYYPYAPYNPQEILGELHEIKAGQIILKHIPFENSIDIDGFRQSNNVDLAENQFYCAYGADQLYRESNCIVYFHPIHNGERVRVNYLQVGTIIDAEDLNEIKAHLENDYIHEHYELPVATYATRGGFRIGEGLTMIGDILNVTGSMSGTVPSSMSGATLEFDDFTQADVDDVFGEIFKAQEGVEEVFRI